MATKSNDGYVQKLFGGKKYLKLFFWSYLLVSLGAAGIWLVDFPWAEAQQYRDLNNTYQNWYTVDIIMAPGFNDIIDKHYWSGAVASNLWFFLPLFCLFGTDRLVEAYFAPLVPWLLISLALLLLGNFMMVPSAMFSMSYLVGGVVFCILNTLRYMFALGRNSWL